MRPLRNVVCKVWDGHEWGTWDPRQFQNLLGLTYRVRWCHKCGARDVASWF